MFTALRSTELSLENSVGETDLKAEEVLRTEEGLRIITAKQIISTISKLAEEKWGEDWFPPFVREYCRIEEIVTGEKPATKNRRSTLERVLKEGSASLETASWMAAAIGAELQLAVYEVRIIRI